MALSPTVTPTASAAPAAETRAVLLNQVSWGAIIAGVAGALVVQILVNLVGLGVGLATLNPEGGDNPAASSLSLGAGLWWVGSGIVASLVGGFLAGRLSGKPSAGTAGYHGLVSWAVTTLVVLYLLTSTVGGILGGAFGGVTSALGGAGSVIGGTVQTAAQTAAPSLTKVSDPLDGISDKVRQSAGNQDPQALRDAAVGAVRGYLSGDEGQKAEAEAKATDALAKAQGIPADQARAQVQDYKRQYEAAAAEARQKAKAAAEKTRSAASQGALYAALALVLGAIAGLLGGRFGAVSPAIAYGERRA